MSATSCLAARVQLPAGFSTSTAYRIEADPRAAIAEGEASWPPPSKRALRLCCHPLGGSIANQIFSPFWIATGNVRDRLGSPVIKLKRVC